jgi:hypothetical protein
MLAADEHENAIAYSVQFTNAVAVDRLTITITSASSDPAMASIK